MYHFFPYIIFSMFSFIMLIGLAIYGLRYCGNIGVREFVFTMVASAWWVFCQAFELMAVTLPVKLFWSQIEYLGMVSGFAFLMLVMRFSGYDKYLSRKNITIVFIIYAVFFSCLFTDQYFGLMRTNFSLDISAIPYIIQKDYGRLYPLYILFAYSMNVAALIMLTRTVLKKDSLYRQQAIFLLLFNVIIMVPNISYIVGISLIKRFDASPAFFGFAALFLAWGIFQHKLLNIMPIARDSLIEWMQSGVIVLDRDYAMIDINPAAQAMLYLENERIFGKNISELQQLKGLLPSWDTNEQQTILLKNDEKNYVYEMKIHPLNDKYEKRVGTLCLLNDITEQQENINKLIQQQKTVSIMRERERMGRELHDGLGQMFGYINAQAQTVREYMLQNKYPQAQKQLEDLISVSRDAHSDIREYIMDMRGIATRNRNFSAVLKQYAADYSKKYGIVVKIHFDDHLPINFPKDDKAIQILGIIQEALINIHKHAGNCQVELYFYL